MIKFLKRKLFDRNFKKLTPAERAERVLKAIKYKKGQLKAERRRLDAALDVNKRALAVLEKQRKSLIKIYGGQNNG